MAPEIWKRESYYGPPVDVWALGALAYELLHNTPCFSDDSMGGLECRIKRGAHNKLHKHTSSAFRALIKGAPPLDALGSEAGKKRDEREHAGRPTNTPPRTHEAHVTVM